MLKNSIAVDVPLPLASMPRRTEIVIGRLIRNDEDDIVLASRRWRTHVHIPVSEDPHEPMVFDTFRNQSSLLLPTHSRDVHHKRLTVHDEGEERGCRVPRSAALGAYGCGATSDPFFYIDRPQLLSPCFPSSPPLQPGGPEPPYLYPPPDNDRDRQRRSRAVRFLAIYRP